MVKYVSQVLGHAPSVTLTSNDSVLLVPGNGNPASALKDCYLTLL